MVLFLSTLPLDCHRWAPLRLAMPERFSWITNLNSFHLQMALFMLNKCMNDRNKTAATVPS
jgi:hypothetical protein